MTKEIVLKDFMCAIISTGVSTALSEETIARNAASYTSAYFNELNKQA